MVIKMKEFTRDRIPYQIEKEQRDFPIFGPKKTKIVEEVRDESLVEVMKRLNDYMKDAKIFNIESIWNIDYKPLGDSSGYVNINNLINIIGYRVFYQE